MVTIHVLIRHEAQPTVKNMHQEPLGKCPATYEALVLESPTFEQELQSAELRD